MRRRGWLAANVSTDNRRHTVRLTPKGTKLFREAFPFWRKAQQEAGRRIGDEGVAALGTLIRRLQAFENVETKTAERQEMDPASHAGVA